MSAHQQFPPNDFFGYLRHDFHLGENSVTVVEPHQPAPGRRWVWRTEFFGVFPAFDLAMLKRGWWIGSISVGNTFGCPDAMLRFDAFHEAMTGTFGFHARPVLEGLSRGGLYAYNWAIKHPDRVGMVYADNPVCDFKSWPGGKGAGPGSSQDWVELLRCYHFADEAEALAWPGNPIDRVGSLVQAGIPLVHSFGDADETVPWQENTQVLAERVAALNGKITLFRKPGGKHHPHGPADPEAFADLVIANASSAMIPAAFSRS